LGVPPLGNGQTLPAYPTSSTLGQVTLTGNSLAPTGVFALGNYVFVADTPENRVVRYDQYTNWPPESTSSSPIQASVIGESDFTTGQPNRNLAQPNAGGLVSPLGGAVNTVTNEVWVADTGNNRILVFPQVGNLQFTAASRVLGQTDFAYGAPNLLEGREIYVSQSGVFTGGGVVVDKNSNPPHLYVADTMNNRILGFVDARKVGADAQSPSLTANLVIGQPNLFTNLPNYSSTNVVASDTQNPNNTGLLRPVGLVVDAAGNLYVADSGNGRILRFPSPFAQPPGVQVANLVLGQLNFSAANTDPDQRTLHTPFGLAQFNDGSLAVSDLTFNRILVFTKPANGDFTNGQLATAVLGQKDYFTIIAGTTTSGLSGPHNIATDTSDFLYVCDTANGRMMVFANASKTVAGNPAALVIPNLNNPFGVTVSALTGEVWIANSSGNQIYRFPQYSVLQGNPVPTDTISSPIPVALALDKYDNLIVVEATNRVSFYFPAMFYRNIANYAAGSGDLALPLVNAGSPVNLTPGMLAELGRYGSDFALTATSGYLPAPWPTTGVNDVEVLANGMPVPIFGLGTTTLFIEVPNELPDSGTVDFSVVQPSTGQILAAATFGMQQASPGIFTASANGLGQAAAQNNNSDGSITLNTAGNGVARGGVITLWLTGAGIIPGLPPSGQPPGAAISTPSVPQVLIGGFPAKVLYSGTSPQLPGLWQINAVVPSNVAPSNTVAVVVVMSAYNYPSNWGGTGANGGPGPDRQLTVGNALIPYIAVKP
jgi:uncharacterized protein (TIGR03437 family)